MPKLLLCALLLAAGPALAQVPYAFTGRIGTLGAPAKIYLVHGSTPLDSATLQNGRFALKGTADLPQPGSAALVLGRTGRFPEGYQQKVFNGEPGLVYVEARDRLPVFLEPGPVLVSSPDSVRTARPSNGPLTADYHRLQAAIRPLVTRLNRGGNSQAESQVIRQQYAQVMRDFVAANPASWVSLEQLQMLDMMAVPQYEQVAPLYNALSPPLRNSPAGRAYGQQVQRLRAVAVGSPAPAFAQQTPAGKTVALADYRGKYVLVDFWASWCGPCRAENPTVLAAYDAFNSRNFEVLGVSLDEEKNRAQWVQAIADDHLPWTQVSDLRGFESEVAQRYNVRLIPQNFLIDPSGNIVAVNLRGPELQATLARLLK